MPSLNSKPRPIRARDPRRSAASAGGGRQLAVGGRREPHAETPSFDMPALCQGARSIKNTLGQRSKIEFEEEERKRERKSFLLRDLKSCHTVLLPPILVPHYPSFLPPFYSFFFFFPFLPFFSFFFLPSFQKVMHTRKRHSELYHELNHSSKFHTLDRYSRDPAMSTFKVRD